MDDLALLNWLYSDLDELIDIYGYEEQQEDENIERTKSNKTCLNNAGPVSDNS